MVWKMKCEAEWIFANPATGMPYQSPSKQQRWIRPAGEAIGIEGLGFHSLRHPYRSWPDSAGIAHGITKGLTRYSAISTTFNVYGRALSPEKRDANRKVVEMLLTSTSELASAQLQPYPTRLKMSRSSCLIPEVVPAKLTVAKVMTCP